MAYALGDSTINIAETSKSDDSFDSLELDLAAHGSPPLGGKFESALADLLAGIGDEDFVAIMRLIEASYPQMPRVGSATRLQDEVARLSQRPSTVFLGRSLESIEETPQRKHRFRLCCNFFGLTGSNGPLPLHYTEYADQRNRHHNDPTFREFLDLFNHRMLSLYYRAIAEFDPSINLDRPLENNFNDILGSVAGLLPVGARRRDSIPDNTKLFYSGWLGGRSKSPDAITSMVGEYFNVAVEVREFIGGWLALPKQSKCRLGGSGGNFSLGSSSYLGHRVWSVNHKFVLAIGPLDWQEFLSFQPGGQRAVQLFDLVRNIVGDEWDWDLELRLAADQAQSLKLDRSRVLGFNSSLCISRSERTLAHQILVNKHTLRQRQSA